VAKHDVVFACGHKSSVVLYGKKEVQKEQLKYISCCLCPDCKREEKMRLSKNQVNVRYSEYHQESRE